MSNMDKWLMFKNYMHNELGITKEDIRQWIEDAVQKQAEALVKKEFNNFDVNRTITKIIADERYFGSPNLKKDIADALAKQILNKLDLNK